MQFTISSNGLRYVPKENLKEFKDEVFKKTSNHGGMYLISTYGRLFSLKSNRILSGYISANGYKRIELYNNGRITKYYAHRLVYEYFGPLNIVPGMHIDHIDGNKLNNHINNLDQVTHSENHKRALNLGLYNFNKPKKISIEKLECILRAIPIIPVSKVAKIFNCSYATVLNIKKGRTYQKEIQVINSINK